MYTLRDKHLPRHGALPELAHLDDAVDFDLDLRETYRMLPRRSGTGPDMLPNEHLTLVTRGYPGNVEATATMALVNRFESDRVNVKLPAWLYWIDAAVSLLALVKMLGVGTAAPDVRPLGLGGTRRRASTTLVVKIVAAEMAEKLYPVQISVGVPSGAHALVFGVRAMTEKTPDFVYVKIDRRNAYNQVHRASIMDALNSDPGLAAYARFRHAYYSRDAPIVIDGRIAVFASCEG
ncbi:hypothetical protein AURANDRAFT_68750, partial [Aureococcus anophagefferens]